MNYYRINAVISLNKVDEILRVPGRLQMEFKIFFLLLASNPSTEFYNIKDICNYASLVKRIKKKISQKAGTILV